MANWCAQTTTTYTYSLTSTLFDVWFYFDPVSTGPSEQLKKHTLPHFPGILGGEAMITHLRKHYSSNVNIRFGALETLAGATCSADKKRDGPPRHLAPLPPSQWQF